MAFARFIRNANYYGNRRTIQAIHCVHHPHQMFLPLPAACLNVVHSRTCPIEHYCNTRHSLPAALSNIMAICCVVILIHCELTFRINLLRIRIHKVIIGL